MLVIASAMVIVIGLASFQNSQSRRAAADESNASRQIRDTTDELLSLLKDAETGQRGYLLTGREAYLEPYNSAVAAIPTLLVRLRSAASGRPDQAPRLASLEPLIGEKLQELAATIELRRSGAQTQALEIVDSGRGKVVMDDIRARCAVIRQASENRASEFGAAAENSAMRLTLISTIGSLILLGIIGFSAGTIFRSFSQRESLYHQAAASAEFLTVTLNSIGDAVIATNLARQITLINPVAQKLTGWSEKDALGTPISKVFRIVNETNRSPVDNPVEKAITNGVVTGLANHTILIAADGNEIPIDDSGAPIRGPKGDIQGGVLVFRDISVRRRAEQMLNESNEQMKEFVTAVAHDLRSPLRSVSSMAQLIALRFQDQIAGEASDLVGYIVKGSQRMQRLLDDLLSYAQATHFESVNANRASMKRALQTAVENLRSEIQGSNAVVAVDSLPDVAAHEAHLVQLFQNIIGNALKYRSDASPRISVACKKDNGNWLVQITDNGIGIDPQYTQLIFKPFQRLHGDRPGSGIGLATCQKIVSGYGGRIWVESQPGKGSTFFFTLPMADRRAADKATHA